MTKAIILAANPQAAAEFMYAACPLWCQREIVSPLIKRHPALAFVDHETGKSVPVEVDWSDSVEIVPTEPGDPRRTKDDQRLLAYLRFSITGRFWTLANGLYIKRLYPLTMLSCDVDVTAKTAMVELGLCLDGIWSSWEECHATEKEDLPSQSMPDVRCDRYSTS